MSEQYKQKIFDENLIQYKSLKALAVMCFILAALMILFGAFYAGAVIAATGAASLYFRKYLLVSFEYEINDGRITVDKIIADKNRKNMVSFDLKDIIIMAPEANCKLKEMNLQPAKTLKLYPKAYLKGIYVIMVRSGEQVFKIKVLPDNKFIDICRKFNKQIVIKE